MNDGSIPDLRDKTTNSRQRDSVLPGVFASLFACFTALFFAPMDMYLNNIGDMWFGISVIWWKLLIIAGLAAGLIILLLLLFRRIDARLYRGAIAIGLGLALGLYIQGYFLNMNAMLLEGQTIAWHMLSREMMVNTAVWLAIFCLPLLVLAFLGRHFGKITVTISILLISMQLVSLVSTIIVAPLAKEEQYYLTKDGQFELADDENIIVFLMDCVGIDYFDEMSEKNPERIAFLDGFTYYPNMVGSYRRTTGAYNYLITGEFYLNQSTLGEYIRNAAVNDTFWRELRALGYSVRLSTHTATLYFSEQQELFENLVKEEPSISSQRTLFAALLKMTAYRFAPMAMKPFMLYDFLEVLDGTKVLPNDQPKPYRKQDVAFYNDLNTFGLTTPYDKAFRLYFLQAAHGPYTMNANIERVPESNYYDQMIGTFKIIEEYVRRLKEADLYDDATIIILADHSIETNDLLGSPVFLLKPKGSSGSLEISGAPISHTDFRATIMQAAGGDYEKYGTPASEWQEGDERERYYYRYYAPASIVDRFQDIHEWKVIGDARDLGNFKETGVVYMMDGTIKKAEKDE